MGRDDAIAAAATAKPAAGDRFAVLAGCLSLLALCARAFAALQTRVITPDGVEFIAIAKKFAAGDFSAALAHRHHPLYPLAVAITGIASGDFSFAAPAVAALMGGLTVIPLVALLRKPFGEKQALFAGFMFSMLPAFVKSGADAISDTTFHFFAISAFWAAFRAMETDRSMRGRLLFAAAGGLLSAAAYYVRPEGLLVPSSLAVMTMLSAARGRARLLRTAAPAALIAAVFLAAIFPYLLHVRDQTGGWDLTKKKPVANMLNVYQGEQGEASDSDDRTDLPRSSSLPGALFLVTRALAHDFFYFPMVLVLIGLAARMSARSAFDEAFFLVPVAVWLAVCFLLARSHGYVSHRHAAPAALLLLGFAGRGGMMLAAAAAKAQFGALKRLTPTRRVTAAAAALAFLIALAGSTTAFRASRSGKVWVKEIGKELGSMGARGEVVFGNRIRISHYAGARHVDIPAMTSWETVVRAIEESGAGFLVVDLLDPHFPVRYKAVLERFGHGGAPPCFEPLREWKIDGSSGRERDVRAFRIDRSALAAGDAGRGRGD